LALQQEPVSVYLTQTIGRSLYYLRRYDEAVDQFHKAQALDPNFVVTHRGLGLVYLQKRMYAEGVAELETAHRLMGRDPWTTGLLGYAYGVSGKRAEAQKVLDEVLQQSRRSTFPAAVVAQVYLGLGDKDHAFTWLRRGVDQGDSHISLLAEPLYDTVRGDSRFTELLQRMKLAR
jgi:Flp pilus assembly protein TadD